MIRSPSSFSFRAPGKSGRSVPVTRGVTDFLRSNDKMAALLPAITRLASLQQDCAAILPAAFDVCSVLQFENGQLTVAAPSTAFASKLKQQLPKVQDGLLKRGWQVNAIRLKVQVRNISERKHPVKQLVLPTKAISALASLNRSLDDSPRNEALKAALNAMLERHQAQK